MYERLESQTAHRLMDGTHVIQRVLARQNDPLDSEIPHYAGTGHVVHSHLGGSMYLQIGIQQADEPHQPEILNDHGVDTEVHRITEKDQRIAQLGRLQEDVQGEIDPPAALVGQATGLADLLQRKLSSLVSRVVSLCTEIDRICAVGECGAYRLERSGGTEEFWRTWHGYGNLASQRPCQNLGLRRSFGGTRHLTRIRHPGGPGRRVPGLLLVRSPQRGG